MNDLEHIYTSHAAEPSGLPPQFQAAAETDSGFQAGLKENRALSMLGAALPAPPERARMLDAACREGEDIKESSMNTITKALTHPHPALRAGLALALVLAVVALSMLLPRQNGLLPGFTPAYAAADGYVLLYVFECESPEQIQPLVDQLIARVKEFKLAHNLPSTEPQKQKKELRGCKIKLEKRDTNEGGSGAAPEQAKKCRAMLAINLEDKSLLEELRSELESIPGLPEPQITEATWFMENNEPGSCEGGDQITLDLGDKAHTFSFPAGAGAEEMKAALTAWLAENEPGMKFNVIVEQNKDAEGNITLMVKVVRPKEAQDGK
jgi:hypothetical protein